MKGRTIFFIAFVLYFVSIFGGLVQDDVRMITVDPEMGQVRPLLASFARPYYYLDAVQSAGAYRPLTSFSFYFNALVTGKAAWGFRLVNVLIYASVCVLVFEVMKKFASDRTAFWGALVFAVLPIHTEAVNNIVGRAEMLSLGFVLLAILSQFKKRWELSAGFLFLALMSKETAIIGLPILIYLLISGKEKRDIKIGASVFCVLITMCYLVIRVVVMGGVGVGSNATIVENPLKFERVESRVLNAFALIPFGVGKTIFPINLSYDYSLNQIKLISSWFDWRVLLGIGMMALSILSLLTPLGKKRLWVLGQAFSWGPILITGNLLFPIGTIFGERLWFLPSLGLVLLAMNCSFPGVKLRYGKWILFLIIALYGVRTVARDFDWLSQDRLFLHDVVYARNSVMAQNNAAAIFLLRGDIGGGRPYLERAREIYPKYQMVMNNWGMFYLMMGDMKLAKKVFEDCLAEDPSNALCEGNLKLVKEGRKVAK